MKKRNIELKADALIVHSLPGRMRLRLPEKKQDVGYFERLLAALSAVSGVSRLAINPRTASVFIHYDFGEADALHHFLEGNDFFAVRKNPAGQEESLSKDEHWRAIKAEIPPARLVALGLVGWSCYKLLRGEWATPEWYVTLWYAHSLYRESEKKMEATKEARN